MNFALTRVILIDDDEDDFVNIRDTLRDIKSSKYELTWKSGFQDGLAALDADDYDLCLLDYRLGQQTGLDLMRQARDQGFLRPIILLTGHGDFDLDMKAMESGAADYLVKSQITAPLLERSIRYSIKRDADLRDIGEQRENFKTLFNSTFEGIVVHRQGRIVDANTAAGEIFQLPSEAMGGLSLKEFLRPDFHDELDRQFESGRGLQMEAVGITKNGHEIFIHMTSRTVNLNGHWASLIAVRDLTPRKQMEAQILQQDRLASLGLLASSLAHEIGTPLGVIRGRAELLQKNPDEKVKGTMTLIVSQIDRITKLVNSLLHIARGQHSDTTSDVALKTVLNDVLNLLSFELNRKNIAFDFEIPDALTVKAEPGPLGQVFLNLLVNAVHAIEAETSRDSHRITITCTAGAREAHISIEDTGCGIPEKNLSRLFQPFFTTKDIGVGTGLGLATSYKLVQSWGGSILVESKEGQGSKFTLVLRT